jgi:hypothetical protein
MLTRKIKLQGHSTTIISHSLYDLVTLGATYSRNELETELFNRILQLLNKRKLEKLKEKWWNQNPEKRRDCEKQDDQTDGISIQNIGR